MRMIDLAAGVALFVVASAAGAQTASVPHQQHDPAPQATARQDKAKADGKCCCDGMKKKMMMGHHHAMGMAMQRGTSQPQPGHAH